MTRPAPSEPTRSTFLVLQTPVTSAPNDFAICTPNVPTPPDAPLMRTFCPGATCAPSRSACKAVDAATAIVPACSNVTPSGLIANALAGVHAYSDHAPRHAPKTASPGLNSLTLPPTAATTPATSTPILGTLGLRKPIIIRTT